VIKKIMILGSEGFIGTHLVKHFSRANWEVHGCDLYAAPSSKYIYKNISGTKDFKDVFSDIIFDACINAAGSGSIPYSISNPVGDFEANDLGTIRILDSIRLFNPACAYLHISSAAVYGNPETLPVKEPDRIKPLSPYGWHKLISEELCKEHHSLYGLKIIIARPFSVYGPGLRKQLFWDLYRKSLGDNVQVELWGTGNESRDFIFIDDLARCFEILIEKAEDGLSIYNIASGEETSIKDVSEKLFSLLCPDKKIFFNKLVRAGDPLNWRADISRLTALGFRPEYSIDDGILKLVQWFKNLN
jgi:UDP-glucose 4-epimerase